MSLKVVSLFSLGNRPRNWSNQELAEFYRVEASLVRAGITVETEQGLSDEGEPWFIFCRAETGDVIIHFARIDGQYVVASPAFGSCVRGRDFRVLIEGLMQQHPVVMPREKQKGKFHIHPAALLVALVTTAFFKMCQGDAVADELHDGSLLNPAHPGGGGSSSSSHQRAAAATQTQMITLDERSAATLMVAVAVAVAWEQATGTDQSQTTTHLVQSDSVSDLIASIDQPVPTIHANLQDGSGQEIHSSGAQQAPVLSNEAQLATLATPAMTAAKAGVEMVTAPVRPVETFDPKTTNDALPVASPSDQAAAVPAPHHAAEPAPDHAPPAPPASEQQHAATETPVTASPSAAMAEVKTIVGELLQTHLAANIDTPEQQLLLSLITGSASHMTGAATAAVAVTEATEILLVKTTDTPATTTLETAFTATTAAVAPVVHTVDDAIHQFMAEHTDFQIIKLDQEIIIYDPSLTPTNVSSAHQETFSFGDGSSVFLIGLPHHAPATALIG